MKASRKNAMPGSELSPMIDISALATSTSMPSGLPVRRISVYDKV